MTVIPVINCSDYKCVKSRVEVLKSLQTSWVKFDISDGTLSNYKTWNKPAQLLDIDNTFFSIWNVSVHFMLEEPLDDIKSWLECGAKRIITHVESNSDILEIKTLCDSFDATLVLSKTPASPIDKFAPYKDYITDLQLLAVSPGPSGQKLQSKTIQEIITLRQLYSDVKIEIDGGINEETAKQVKNAGADIIVTSSYIFDSDNPKKSFNKLQSI